MSKQQRPEREVIRGLHYSIEDNGEAVEILPLADLHIGDPTCNMGLVRDLISGLQEKKNRYAVVVGDLLNCAVQGSKSDIYTETMSPDDQLEACYDLLLPVKEKLLAFVPGNHEERIAKTDGVSMVKVLAKELGLAERYRDTSALVFLTFGQDPYVSGRKLTYSMYINHGHGGGGRRPGSKINALQDYAAIVDVDLYIVGHTHLPLMFKQGAYKVNANTYTATRREQLFVNTASALGYVGGYGDRGGYVPGSNSYPVITLDNKQHHLSATL